MKLKNKSRTVFGHPLAALGGALVLAGGFLFIILLLIDASAGDDNPYRSLVTFVAAPAVVTLGALIFLLAIFIQVRAARKRGEKVRFNISIDPTDPAYMRNLWLFLGTFAALATIVIFSGTKAYEATDSVGFCGETCHTVMEPQYVTYQNSPHARVPCVECHIGPGASFWVKAKLDGARQVVAAALNTYSRPIETPVRNLRPAQQTCEGCHWPQQFYGRKMINRTYYRTDEENSPWSISLLMKIGGGNPRTGKLEGIHWHMISANTIDYVSTDAKRQTIPWVRLINTEGDTIIYSESDGVMPDTSQPDVELRRFDCMDCHNRPSHKFPATATSLNLALSTHRMSPDLPSIRATGLELLNAEYETREQAHEKIVAGLHDFYNSNYAERADSLKPLIDQAAEGLLSIYDNSFFPEMKTDYRARENNLSHFVNSGCFRCHDGYKTNEAGEALHNECTACHLIVAQGPSENIEDLESNITGLEFKHPEDIDEAWREMHCTDCHTPDQGY